VIRLAKKAKAAIDAHMRAMQKPPAAKAPNGAFRGPPIDRRNNGPVKKQTL